VDALWEVGASGASGTTTTIGALKSCGSEYKAKECLLAALRDVFFDGGRAGLAHSLPLARSPPLAPGSMDRVFAHAVDDIYAVFRNSGAGGGGADRIDRLLSILNKAFLPAHPLRGDPVIQIGTTVHVYGERQASARFVHVLGTCAHVADDVQSYSCETEADLLREWAKMVRSLDPDVLTGYNIFGFDFEYLHSRAVALGVESHLARDLTRLPEVPAKLVVREMSSSALGDNILKFIDMPGRVLVDLMKVVQRDHRLESYKLDAVARHFTGDAKDDISPKDIFRLQKGSDEDRAVIARYCVQDCALCNQLVSKLEILANNIGMANVCWVPLSHIFMRGQGVKIFSLVAKQCREDGFLIPTKRYIPRPDGGDEEGYEGAIVLEPETGMYLDEPVSVLDYNSLYPSSMISENISHDTLVLDDRRGNEAAAEGVEFVEVRPAADARPCRFAQTRKGVLPRILEMLLLNRKQTRERAKHVRVLDGEAIVFEGPERDVPDALRGEPYAVRPAYSSFERAVLDGLQLAYKVTANSLYGQMGARTSPLYLREVAACTTATGRAMIMQAKDFIETRFHGRVVYGDTDSLFVVFPPPASPQSSDLCERDTLASSIAAGQSVSRDIKAHLKQPHNLEYEKTFFPLVLLSKKRYVGLQYEDDPDAQPKQKSMGIALKRRDYAPVVKQCYGGVIDIILTRRDVPAAVAFLDGRLKELAAGRTPLEDLVISKTLKSHYKFPEQIAHAVLARRMFQRDPGSAPQVNDRIPYVFVETTKKNALMGDRIEHVDFVRANPQKVRVDAKTYIENQVMKPCTQLLAIALEQIPGYAYRDALSGPRALKELVELKAGDTVKARERLGALREREVERLVFAPVLGADDIRRSVNRCNGQKEISSFFAPRKAPGATAATNPTRPL
jgi:DNA polymerase delta subunit 1